MDRVSKYLEAVPLPIVLAGAIGALLLFLLMPANRRLSFFIICLVCSLVIGRMPDLGALHAIVKVASPGFFAIVCVAALMHPGEKRRLSFLPWLYPIIAIFSFFFILTVTDYTLAFTLRLQWLLLTLSALFIARTMVDENSIKYVLNAITIGLCLAALFPLAALVKNPKSAFSMGLHRFEPWGAPSNQIGVELAAAAVLALYASYSAKKVLMRWIFFGFMIVAAGQGVLTASRSTLAVILVVSLPVCFALIRRPIFAITGVSLVVLGLVWFLGYTEAGKLDRLFTFETARVQQAEWYVNEIILERPLLGLLETSGESVLQDESARAHPHNAYLETLYVGGLVYAIPVFGLIVSTIWATITVWLRRRELQMDRLLLSFLVVTMVMVYAHGFVNGSILYPTYSWAFIHVLLSVMFLSIASAIRRNDIPLYENIEYIEEDEQEYDENQQQNPASIYS